MFKVDTIENLVIILCIFISGTLCQDRIIMEDASLNDAHNNLTMENEIIPEKLLIRMNEVKNISDFIRLFITPQESTSLNGSDNSNDTSKRRAWSTGVPAASIAKPANCQIEQHVIELEKPENEAMIFWPSCIRVRRCGGCCTSKLQACKPLQTSILHVTVLQMKYNHQTPNSFEDQGIRIFSIEQHEQCRCTCKEGPDDCNPDVHRYKPEECRCVCKNKEAAINCTGSNKFWDPKDCLCKCRTVGLCSSGRFFNELSCRCEFQRRARLENLHNSTLVQSTLTGA